MGWGGRGKGYDTRKIVGIFAAKFSAKLVPSMTLKGSRGRGSELDTTMMFSVPNSVWSFSLNYVGGFCRIKF